MKFLPAVMLCLLSAALPVAAQTAGRCPALPAESGLQWSEQQAAGFVACRASTADGREVLSLMLTGNDPDIPMPRALRQEKDQFAGESLYWYQPDLGGQQPQGYAHRRITVVRLDKDRYVQMALYPSDEQERGTLQGLVRSINLNAATVAAGH